jgi:hypothetical protein
MNVKERKIRNMAGKIFHKLLLPVFKLFSKIITIDRKIRMPEVTNPSTIPLLVRSSKKIPDSIQKMPVIIS